MNRKQRNVWLFVALIFATGVVYYMLTVLFDYPGRILLNIGGDAAKNYYTYLYHSVYGSGYWFTGMNYPYGEHIVYTDGQPFLSVTLSYLREFLPVNIATALAVMHIAITVSYIAAIVFSYKILVYYRVQPWFAILFAAMIIVMSPQTCRIDGHFALSHACYIPMYIYWLLCYNHHHKPRYLLYMLIITVVLSFIHPYYVALCLVFTGFYCLGYLLFVKARFLLKLMRTARIIAVPFAAILLLKGFMALTDPVTDRPEIPQGTMWTLTESIDIFTGFYSPVSMAGKRNGWFPSVDSFREGAAYTGISVLFIAIISIIVLLIRKFRKGTEGLAPSTNETASVWLTVAIGALLLGMGVPFIWDMEWLFDKMSLFRQFRSLGRFSVIYYYVIALYAVVILHRFHASLLLHGRRLVSYTVICLPLFLWAIEAAGNIAYVKKGNIEQLKGDFDFFFSPTEDNWVTYLGEAGYNSHDFQSILILPYTHIGSEKLWINADGLWSMVLGFKASLQLHLPINDVLMSRTSWSQTKKQVRMEGGPWAHKSILDDVSNSKPFLLLVYDEATLEPGQRYLLKAADSVGNFSRFNIFLCYPERIKANDILEYNNIRNFISGTPMKDTCVTGDKRNLYINHFDGTQAENIFAGSGALSYLASADTVVADFPVTILKEEERYEFSCWVMADTIGYKSPYFTLEKLDSAGVVINEEVVAISQSSDNYGMWFRTAKHITLPVNSRRLRVRLRESEVNSYIGIDELMLRNAGATIVYRNANGALMINNHLQSKK